MNHKKQKKFKHEIICKFLNYASNKQPKILNEFIIYCYDNLEQKVYNKKISAKIIITECLKYFNLHSIDYKAKISKYSKLYGPYGNWSIKYDKIIYVNSKQFANNKECQLCDTCHKFYSNSRKPTCQGCKKYGNIKHFAIPTLINNNLHYRLSQYCQYCTFINKPYNPKKLNISEIINNFNVLDIARNSFFVFWKNELNEIKYIKKRWSELKKQTQNFILLQVCIYNYLLKLQTCL